MKNKYKIFTGLLLLGFIFSGYLNFVTANQPRIISKINPRFCNGGVVTNRLDLKEAAVETDVEICLAALNSADIDLNVKMYFVDGIEDPASKQISCASEKADKLGMSKFINFPLSKYNNIDSETDTLIYKIRGGETLEMRANLKLPESFKGRSHGCLVTQVSDQKIETGKINILVRRANIVSVTANGNPNYILGSNGDFGDQDGKSLISKNKDIFVAREDETGNLLIGTTLVNNGNTKLKVDVNFELNGNGINVVNDGKIELSPGESKPISQVYPDISSFGIGYKSSITVKYSPIFEYKTDFTDNPQITEDMSLKLGYDFNLIPIKSIGLVLGVLILLFILLIKILTSLKLKKAKLAKMIEKYTVKKGDTIESIGFDCGVTWKKLVKINNLRPPYHIEPGDVLAVLKIKNVSDKEVSSKDKEVSKSPTKKKVLDIKIDNKINNTKKAEQKKVLIKGPIQKKPAIKKSSTKKSVLKKKVLNKPLGK